ncbi:TetR/AcrR family transcriptional regulator [Pseudohongiella nitratireducens]|uniref:TetR/AcrR family transcriptional regulator n=1 Tax=Pseudohongiella nitratireducens TaxID=1768907 RepID=UPI0030EDEAFE
MSTRDVQIISAALKLFFRYGMARTTMNDIAREAGLSRQSVYAAFANKEELLRAATRHLADQTVADLINGFATADSAEQKLDVIFESIAGKHFALLCSSPDADDVISGFNTACRHELADAAERYQHLIAEALQEYEPAITRAGIDMTALAENIQRTTKALKYEAKDEAHLRELWKTQRTLLLQLLAP